MKTKLLSENIRSLPITGTPYRVWDTEIKGYHLRVGKTGTMTYYLKYRLDGKEYNYRIGKHGKTTPPNARNKAKTLAGLAASGTNIQELKHEKEEAAEKARLDEKLAKSRTLRHYLDNHYRPWVLVERKSGKTTLEILDRYFSQWYDKQIPSINVFLVGTWRTKKLKEGLKPATLNSATARLKAVFSKAVEDDIIEKSPLLKLKPLKNDSDPIVRYLTPAEDQRLANALVARDKRIKTRRKSHNEWLSVRNLPLSPDNSGDRYGDYLHPMVQLALHTGMRRGELFKLEWSQVNLITRTVTITAANAKSRKQRHIPLNDSALTALSRWQKQTTDSGLVFPNLKTGKPLTDIKKAWNKLLEDAKIEGFRFHDCRHTFASRLVMGEVDLYTVKELMGHSSIEMTGKYAHLAPEKLLDAVGVIG